MTTYDPWGSLNRFTYRFNAHFDEAVFLPVANGYRRLPSPMRAGVHNFFGNIAEIDSFINYTLQGRLGRTVRSLGRFVINSTLGIGDYSIRQRSSICLKTRQVLGRRSPSGACIPAPIWSSHSTAPRPCVAESDWRPTTARST